MPHPTRLASSLFATALLFAFTAVAQTPAPQPRRPPVSTSHRPATPASPAAQAVPAASAYKGIFEPVNYPQDINLTDVFFVSPEVGWVSGEHATILKTTDGGAHWVAQVGGDPSGNEKPISQLRFLDARHGWAVTDDGPQRLLRTMDGENWQQIGQQPAPGSGFLDYAFTSVRHGIALGGNMGGFYVTNDGGRHWLNISPCKVQVRVQGLARTEDCRVQRLQMLSARSGYASAEWSSGLAFFRTDDGGEHWTSLVNDISDWSGNNDFYFTDLDHGVILFNGSNRTYVTSDGARTWHALLSGSIGLNTGGRSPLLRFADPQVGWVIGPSPDNSDTFRVSYSTDSGQHWKMSHNISFPMGPRYQELRFNFPRRDRAYVIGSHGMIYRYRIVPANYTAAGILEAPLMPEPEMSELSAKVDAIRRDIESLRSKLPATPEQAGVESASATNATARPGSQQTDMSSAATGGGFTQDTSPVSPALADCCSAAIQNLQNDTAGFAQQAPATASLYKPLNLIVAGSQWVINVTNQAQNVWNSFLALKRAVNPQAASAALQQFSAGVNMTQKTTSTGFQDPAGWFSANAPADFVQDVGPSSSMSSGPGFAGTSPMDASAAQSGNGAGVQPHSATTAANVSVNQAMDKAKKVKDSVRSWLH